MTTYRWTHDASRECLVLSSPTDPDGDTLVVDAAPDSYVSGAYQLGIGDTEREIVFLDAAHSKPPYYRALRGLWGTPSRSHFTGTPLIPARRLYLDF